MKTRGIEALCLALLLTMAGAAFAQEPSGADQVLSASYDSTTTALKVDCVAGCGSSGGSSSSALFQVNGLNDASQSLLNFQNGTNIVVTNPSSGNVQFNFTGILPVTSGGTGTATPSVVAGPNIAISGNWPNQTVGFTGVLPTVSGGTGTSTPSLVSGTNISITGTWPNQTVGFSGVLPVANGGTGLGSLGTAGQCLQVNSSGTALIYSSCGSAGGSGTLTNFSAGSLSPLFSTSVANPTTTPALSFTLNSQNVNTFFAGPSSGSAAAPTFRSLVSTDLPAINLATTGNGGVTGTLGISNGGTGTTTPALAAGAGISITGTWPNNTISFSGTLAATQSATSHEWLNSYTASTGVFTASQPSFSDLAGTAAVTQLPSSVTQFTGTITSGDCATWSSSGVLTDAGAACGSGSGSGTVTSLSAGNLSPLFTTSVATATTAPALSFTLSNAAAYSWFGNATGSSAAPTFNTSALPSALIPTPTATTLGGIESAAAVAHEWINSISTSGVPALSQPSFGDISGTVAASQLPAPTSTTLGGVESATAPTSEFQTGISTSGAPTFAQPSFSNLSGTASASQVPNPAGDVTGTYAATTVTGLHFGTQTAPLSSTALSSGQCLGYNGTNILGVTCGSGGSGTATAVQFGTNSPITLSSTNPTSGQYLEYNGTNIVGVSGTSGPATQLQFGSNTPITLSSSNPISGEILQYNGTNIQGYNLVCGDMPSGLTWLCNEAATTQQATANAILTLVGSPTTGSSLGYDSSGNWDMVPGNTTTAQPWSWLEASGVNNGLPEMLPPVEISMPSSIAAGYPDLLVTGTTSAAVAAAGSATGLIGIAEFSTGSAVWIATSGPARCIFSNTAVIGDYFGIVPTGGTAGDCYDYGTGAPSAVENRGRVLSAGTGAQDVWLWPENASNGGGGGSSSSAPADIQISTGTTAIAANTCTAYTATTMTGVTSTMAFNITPTSATATVTGWGASGGLVITAYPTANTINWALCNQTGASITPSASVTWNVSAR